MFSFHKSLMFAVIVPLVIATSSCASMASTRDSISNSNDSASSLPTSLLKTPIKTSSAIDKNTEHWEKERLNYLRSLDYQKIALQNNPQKQYMLKANLVESRFDIKSSELALYQDDDLRSAMLDLNDALKHYKHAAKLANQKELPKLGNTERSIESLINNTDKNMRCSCEHPRPSQYHKIEANLETLLAKL